MKSTFLLVAILLLKVFFASGQETILVENKFGDLKQVSEKFYVLKSDGRTKHGQYIKYDKASEDELKKIKSGQMDLEFFIKDSGAFENGKKIGFWRESSASGNYEAGKKVGVWFTRVGREVIQKYDYDNNKQLPPDINVSVKYPPFARENNIQGDVTVNFRLNPDCTLSNIRIEKPLSPDCDSSAMEAVRRMDDLYRTYGANCPDSSITMDFKFRLK